MSTALVVPAIIPESLAHLREELTRVSFAPAVQVDVVDGVFAPRVSWPYGKGEQTGSPTEARELLAPFALEVDLMVERPEEHLDEWLAAGASRLVVHLESTECMEDILDHARTHPYALGLAFDDDTPLAQVRPYLGRVAFIQCMGIDHVGAQGEPFERRVLDNIRALKASCPGLSVQVDGSVNRDTLLLLAAAGAERFVVGSAILGADDPRAAYEELCTLAS